jgi:hypothetical protein
MTHHQTADERQPPNIKCSSDGVVKDSALHLYSVSTQFESWQEHRLNCRTFSSFSSIPSRKMSVRVAGLRTEILNWHVPTQTWCSFGRCNLVPFVSVIISVLLTVRVGNTSLWLYISFVGYVKICPCTYLNTLWQRSKVDCRYSSIHS